MPPPERPTPPGPPPPPPPPPDNPPAPPAPAAAAGPPAAPAEEPEWLAGTGLNSQTIPEPLRPVYANLDKGWKTAMQKRADEHKKAIEDARAQYGDYDELKSWYETYAPLIESDPVLKSRLDALVDGQPWDASNGGAPAGGQPGANLTPEQLVAQVEARLDAKLRLQEAGVALKEFRAMVGDERLAPLARTLNAELKHMAGSRLPMNEKLIRAWRLVGGEWPLKTAAAPANPPAAAGAAAGAPAAPAGPERARGGAAAPLPPPPKGADSMERMKYAAQKAAAELGLSLA